ncbi:MAG: TatD family hydrolase, partial [Dehalococcoidia bacterium]
HAIDLGFYMSIARPLFRIPELKTVVKELPLDNLVIETDSFPQYFKKNRNNWTEPRHLRSIIDEISRIKDEDSTYIENMIFSNTKKILTRKWSLITKYIPELSSNLT